ncbi:hypothetical protein Poli38472_004903 [Pythium oligandrum]|uniref:Uncharacterized protein n=1 Tax=Pythium oligandrum TaxID=41045 RepID=A0A8K1FGB3_PYTOL|nr:hypothetical protein Poli38472_004903 [Pythium oligandrum]|eukprot:TMW59834.1 hypothetical protein Poli38472_004903 [Pythium oligandrum]
MESDSHALMAALAVLDAWDDDDDWLLRGEGAMIELPDDGDAASTDSDEVRQKKEGRRPVASTKNSKKCTSTRRREEIAFLRAKADELQEELAGLKQRRADVTVEPDTDSSSMWEEIAARQYCERQMVEQENTRLRAMLADEVRISEELMQLRQRQLRIETKARRSIPGFVQHEKRPKRLWSANEPVRLIGHDTTQQVDDLALEQMRRCEELFNEADAIFSSKLFGSEKRTFRQVDFQEDGCGGMLVLMQAAWLMPFDTTSVADALWDYFTRKPSEKEHSKFQNVKLDKDSSLLSFTAKSFENDHTIQVKIGTQRRKIGDMERVVADFRGSPVDGTPSPLHGFSVCGEGWMQVQALPLNIRQGAAPRQPELAQVYLFRRIRVTSLAADAVSSGDQKQSMNAFTEVMVKHMSEDIKASQQIIENELLYGPSEPAEPNPISCGLASPTAEAFEAVLDCFSDEPECRDMSVVPHSQLIADVSTEIVPTR